MGHLLLPSLSNTLHRKNTGQCPPHLDVRKFSQCYSHVYLLSDTGNNHQAFISKTLLAFPIRFCDKVTTWVTSEAIFSIGPMGYWANHRGCSYVPRTWMNALSLSHLPSVEQEICTSECGIKGPWKKTFLSLLLTNKSHGPRRVPRPDWALCKYLFST